MSKSVSAVYNRFVAESPAFGDGNNTSGLYVRLMTVPCLNISCLS